MGPALTVLDASALLAALRGEPGRPLVEQLLRSTPPPSIAAVNLAEVVDQLVRIAGIPAEQVRDLIDWLIVGGMEVEPVWLPAARLAGELRARYYDRERAPLSLADCVCLASALHLATGVATTDPVVASVARQLGIEVVAVPDSNGELP